MRTIFTEGKNIRSTGPTPVRFTPAEQGITSVTGANGAGKTTLTTLIPLLAAWGDAKSVAGTLGEVIAEGAKSGKATWCVQQGDHTYLISRTITRTTTGATSKVTIEVDGSTAQTKGMRATEAAKFISDALGVGPDEFLATSLIAQGEIDNLTSATPAVVRDQVRRTLGLDRAVKAADRLDREVKPARDALPEAPDPATVKRAQAAAIDAAGAEVTARNDTDTTAKTAEQSAAQVAATREAVTAARRDYDTWRAAAGSLTEAERALSTAEADLESAAGAVSTAAADANYHGEPEMAVVTARYNELTNQRAEVQRVQDRLDHLPAEANVADIEAAHQAAVAAVGSAKKAFDAAQVSPEVTGEASANAARAADLEESARTLDGHGECPTCHMHLSDSGALVASLRNQAAELREKAAAAKKEAEALAAERQRAADAVTAAEAQERAEAGALSAARQAAETRGNEQAALQRALNGWSVEQIAAVCAQVSALGTALERRDAAAAAVRTASGRVEEVRGLAAGNGDELKAALDAAEQAHVTAEATGQRQANAAAAAKATHSAAVGEWKRLTASSDQLAAAVAARAEAEKAIGDKLAAAKALREFAAAYTAEKVTSIEDSVNALLRGVSSGFTRFRLGTNFAPAVQVEDTWRPTHELSGGESAVVGLMLRIGIVAAITGGALDVSVTADEPLANLDARARRQVSDMLAQLPCPVTVISHSDEPAEAASCRVEVSRDPLTGSTVLATV
ncbi:AAA family ATPase [Corynebacterium sp. AOP12-C2-36]|uniref:AAA family ATPase n=1 Tax=Corynebacterium sp. AOP12-C2-36 TaxID=3457723 RepID=UPI004033C595